MANEHRVSEKTLKKFPLLKEGQYRKTSDKTSLYNCIAFALDDEENWWQPPNCGWDVGMRWHMDAPDDDVCCTYIRLFELHGYECCENPTLEEGFDKVAIYWGEDGVHVAKQKADGKWKSKLGDWEDIEHDLLELLETDGDKPAYSKVQQIVKKKKK